MAPVQSSKRRRKTNSCHSIFQPDSGQIEYDDMFVALTPADGPPKSNGRKRLSLLPKSGERYMDELIYYSRTKPLPPLPVDANRKSQRQPELERKPSAGSLAVLFRWLKGDAKAISDVSLSKISELRARQLSNASSNGPPVDISRTNSNRSQSSRRKYYAPAPWSRKGSNSANKPSLMYGDLAEIPATHTRRADSAMSMVDMRKKSDEGRKKSDESRLVRKPSKDSRGPRKASSDDQKAHSSERALRPLESQALTLRKPDHSGDVSREEFDFLWNQYQQLSRTMQEALQQRTTELAG